MSSSNGILAEPKQTYRELFLTALRGQRTLLGLIVLTLLNVLIFMNVLYQRNAAVGISHNRGPMRHAEDRNPIHTSLVKPENITISGLVFFGRKDRVESMHCYLERNMVDNGGWLDEVLWVVNTENKNDLAYLNKILSSSPQRYKKLDLGRKVKGPEFRQIWKHLDKGKMYVKVDDDVVWLADDAIPIIVDRKIRNPDDFAVSANIINNPPLSFMHYHFGALHPYFPELDENGNATKKVSSNKAWRPSEHPHWDGPPSFTWAMDAKPPAKGHRWLRVEDDKAIARTPVSKLKYEVWGDTYTSWAIAAQQHYSFLENLESDNLDVYKFNRPWNMDNERIRINVLAVMADDILDSDIDSWPKERSDEEMIVMELPKKYLRPVNVIGTALAAHFNFQHQPDVAQTDLLARYRALALEQACLSR
ncbi:conserved hypothetical protein [Uncinocarpus reesii 1704]|uniref:Uncharacterized protein n=1 Tax=Uncinocarpus reesii (strain UAMH 1704) TaxID=336963 RepID=C4JT05_UNCRE|nr:uncharacterized protein UREG_05594 [Uncinocarpus reesii 1704]EEP80752.1 conserved hypothetical protein [Uncinocarpus reesii 1704]